MCDNLNPDGIMLIVGAGLGLAAIALMWACTKVMTSPFYRRHK